MKTFLALVLFAVFAVPSPAQVLLDTTFTWRGYRNVSTCRVQIYRSIQKASRPVTVVIDELAENGGRSTLDDAPHLVELLGRSFRIEPDSAFWIFHWGSFSFDGAQRVDKELFFRATFRRNDGGSLGPPFWRLVNRETVREYTDRAFW